MFFDKSFALAGFNEVTTSGLAINLDDREGGFAAELVTGSQVGISQQVANPGQMFSLAFEANFVSGDGLLEVFLDDILLTSLSPAGTGFQSFAMDFDLTTLLAPSELASFLGKSMLDLSFLFDGPTGTELLLDGIAFNGITNGDFSTGDLRGWTALLPEGAGAVGTTARLTSVEAPEPHTAAIMLLGVAAVVGVRRRKRSTQARR